MLTKIESLIIAIRNKHNTCCTFTILSKGDDVYYQTYIADNYMDEYSHLSHDTIEEAISRFEHYLSIDDVTAQNISAIKVKIRQMRLNKEDIEYDIHTLENIMKQLEELSK